LIITSCFKVRVLKDSDFNVKKHLILEDTTLRDGEAPGLAFGKEAKLEIYKALVCAGVRWIDVRIPAMGGGKN